jgi:hypothetical protein
MPSIGSMLRGEAEQEVKAAKERAEWQEMDRGAPAVILERWAPPVPAQPGPASTQELSKPLTEPMGAATTAGAAALPSLFPAQPPDLVKLVSASTSEWLRILRDIEENPIASTQGLSTSAAAAATAPVDEAAGGAGLLSGRSLSPEWNALFSMHTGDWSQLVQELEKGVVKAGAEEEEEEEEEEDRAPADAAGRDELSKEMEEEEGGARKRVRVD